jgi:hypothetical protein
MMDGDPRFETCAVSRTERTSCRATVGQEYFYFLEKQDGDPRAFTHSTIFFLEGALDAERLARCVVATIDASSIYRTVLEERGGHIVQRVRDDAPPPVVEQLDRSGMPESEWRTVCTRIIDERAASGFGESPLARAAIVTLGADRHALVLMFHHAVNDGGSLEAFVREVFARYAGAAPEPALSYIDYAASLESWASTENGRAQQARWSSALQGAEPLVLPADHPRDELEALCARVPHGITAETMHPVQHVPLSPEVVAAVGQTARRERTSPFAVFLAAFAATLRALSGQDDISIESSYSPRFNLRLHRQLGPIHGLITTWTIARVRLAGADTFAEQIRRARDTTCEIQELGPIWRYYETVPVGLRRAVFNYVPMSAPTSELAPGLRSKRMSPGFPIWKRPWELHLTVIDHRTTTLLFWTCNSRLFRAETSQRFLETFLAALIS